jgi:hypothetical protein
MHPRTKRHWKRIIHPIARLIAGYVVMILIATLAILALILL